ncbi:MAG: T9SS type A sorting domain-containing protein, partial [Chitinophagaceae bacterium]|nr:T9SS type A sorting domain-containing protein [Chitinophagaceae bacterium]
VTDGAPVNTVPGGDLSFIAPRPDVPSNWRASTACLSVYSAGNALQNIDGGNVPMDISLRLNNDNHVLLINTPTRIEGQLQWDMAGSNIELAGQDLILTQNAAQDGYREDRFAITNGSGHLVKENYTGDWIFPVGIARNDYTPAAINNSTANTMHVLVQDYATSASDEELSSSIGDGMDRTWNIYADIATGNAVINLQHNTVTNQASFNNGYNFVTRWSDTIPNPSGDYVVPFTSSAWQTNTPASGTTGNLSSTGIVAGSNMRSRTYTDFATAAGDHIAYFTKSSDPYHPQPVQLVSFSALAANCDVLIEFTTGVETGINKLQVQHSTDGVTFSTIATFSPGGTNTTYRFRHEGAAEGKNFYRVVLIEASGDYTRSAVKTVAVSCEKTGPKLELYPNPATDYITVSGMTGPTEIRIMNELGRLMSAVSSVANKEIINISHLPAATYVVSVFARGQALAHFKLIRQ